MQEDMAVMTVYIFLMMALLFYTDIPQLYLVNIILIKMCSFLSGKTKELFEVYATQNKSLGSDIRINYAGFRKRK